MDDMHEIIKSCSREGFKACFYNANGFGRFKGKVAQIKGNRYLFKRVFASWFEGPDFHECVDGEDHVWIIDGEPFAEAEIAVGDSVEFDGHVELYRRADGTYDLGIRHPDFIEKIPGYELPSDDVMERQFMRSLRCEICLYSSQCYGTICFMDL